MISILYLIIAILITTMFHEFGHMITALLCGVKVEAFSVGFGKPYLHKKFKGIDFRLSPIWLGGYVKLAGEEDKRPNGLLAQPYHKKVLIVLAGICLNFILATICYLINYNSIKIGVLIDWAIIKGAFTHDYTNLLFYFNLFQPNLLLLQISIINLFCGLFNLIPFPALDGSYLWMFLLEKKITNFKKFLVTIRKIGFYTLIIVQLIFLEWFFFWR